MSRNENQASVWMGWILLSELLAPLVLYFKYRYREWSYDKTKEAKRRTRLQNILSDPVLLEMTKREIRMDLAARYNIMDSTPAKNSDSIERRVEQEIEDMKAKALLPVDVSQHVSRKREWMQVWIRTSRRGYKRTVFIVLALLVYVPVSFTEKGTRANHVCQSLDLMLLVVLMWAAVDRKLYLMEK